MALNDIKGIRENGSSTYDEILLNKVWSTNHGIESNGALLFNDSTHIFTIGTATNSYWFNGVNFTTASAITKDLDDDYTITTDTMYFFYFDDVSGVLKVSTLPWDLTTKIPVATVFWNGSAGAVAKETHGYRRPLDWHINAHLTIGARISPSDFAVTAPNVGSPTTIAVAGGTLYDEDLQSTYTAQSNCRVWYQTGATTYRWADSNSIYPTNVRFVDSANAYTLTDVAATDFINVWIYASPDIARPIYCFTETKATVGHNTSALARAVNPPMLSNFGLTPELKLLYRVIMKGDETWVEQTDYRASASLPAGGSSAPTAAAVTFAIAGNISSTNVQSAIEELDTEKQATLTFGIAQNNAVKVSAADVANGEFAKFTATGLESRTTAEVLSDIGAASTASVPVKATGAELVTGTDDAKFATAKALKDGEFIPIHVGTTAPADTTKLWLDTN